MQAGAKYVGKQSKTQLDADVKTVSRNRTDELQGMHSGHWDDVAVKSMYEPRAQEGALH
jgi:hypothetical protein